MVSVTEKDTSASKATIIGSVFLYPILSHVVYDPVKSNHLRIHLFYVL